MTFDLSRRAALASFAAIAGASMLARTSAAEEVSGSLPAGLSRTVAAQISLPFAENALAPVISAQTIGIHYGKHHKAYADKLAELTVETKFEGMALEDIIFAASSDPASAALLHAAAQTWNHNFYWQSLTATPQSPDGRLKLEIEKTFGSLDACLAALSKAGVTQFGSGWAWLVWDGKEVGVESTSNADIPFLRGRIPLLTVDVWEHAYYLDYQNRRADHLAAVLGKTANWAFAAANLPAPT